MPKYVKRKNSYKVKIFIFSLYLVIIYLGIQNRNIIQFDRYERLKDFPGKFLVDCPIQKHRTGVLLAIGQSNSANYAEKKWATEFPDKVVNYFDGRCYVASSPLMGASGIYGEFITPLADQLIKDGIFEDVVILSAGIGGSPISRWRKGGDLNNMLLEVLKRSGATYKITDIVWHQGEADLLLGTSAEEYYRSFHSLIDTLEGMTTNAKVFISISTKCGDDLTWSVNNAVSSGQKALVDNKHIFLGANTDVLLERQDRRIEDNCHLSQSGQIKTARSYANSIGNAHRIQ